MPDRLDGTIDSLALEFDENRAHALRMGQVGAAVQATAMKAKLFGFMVDRQQVQVEHTLRKPSADENAPAEMSLEDWQAKYGGSSGPVVICGTTRLARAFFRRLIMRERCGHMFGLSARFWTAGLDEVRDASG